MHAGEEGHARPGWTTSRRGQDSPWKSQSERQRTEINGESTSMVWPTLGSRTAKEQNRVSSEEVEPSHVSVVKLVIQPDTHLSATRLRGVDSVHLRVSLMDTCPHIEIFNTIRAIVDSTMWFMVCRWPQSQEGDWARPHLCHQT